MPSQLPSFNAWDVLEWRGQIREHESSGKNLGERGRRKSTEEWLPLAPVMEK